MSENKCADSYGEVTKLTLVDEDGKVLGVFSNQLELDMHEACMCVSQAVYEVIDWVGKEGAWHVFEDATVEIENRNDRNMFCFSDEDVELYDELLYMRGLTKIKEESA